MFKTYQPKASDIKREWHLIDVKDQVLGRQATKIATLLIGKHKKTYTPHLDMGDNVVVINAGQVRLTGRKEEQKTYYRYSGYPGGLKKTPVARMRKEHPARIIELAVRNMLPKNRLQDPRMTRLKVFAKEEHQYANKFEIQNPKSETNSKS